MRLWIPQRDAYLRELLRHDGRGVYARERCESCPDGAVHGHATIHCLDCSPSPHVCPPCAVRRHAHSPWHRVQVSVRLTIPVSMC